MLRRLRDDQQSSAEHEEFRTMYLWQSLKDWKTYAGMLIFMGVDGIPFSPHCWWNKAGW